MAAIIRVFEGKSSAVRWGSGAIDICCEKRTLSTPLRLAVCQSQEFAIGDIPRQNLVPSRPNVNVLVKRGGS